MMMFALAVAASARSPRNCPTQIELTELDSVWRMFDASVGSANRTSVLAIGPCVRSIGRLPRAVCRGGIGPEAGSAAATTGTTGVSSLTPAGPAPRSAGRPRRSEEHKSELQSLMRISDARLWLQKKNI